MKNKHWLTMGICVLGMGAVIAYAIPSVRSSLGNLGGGNWIWLMALLCPLSHVLMMSGMHHGKNDASCHDQNVKTISETGGDGQHPVESSERA
jgi:hypothetical protein